MKFAMFVKTLQPSTWKIECLKAVPPQPSRHIQASVEAAVFKLKCKHTSGYHYLYFPSCVKIDCCFIKVTIYCHACTQSIYLRHDEYPNE